jgi:hypothetical protein
MSRFNKTTPPVRVAAPLAPAKIATGKTGNQAPGFERDAKGELFTLAVSNFGGFDSAYETGAKRDERYASLIHAVAASDPAWMAQFLRWLRDGANMRTASMIGGIEAARAMLAAKIPGGRAIVSSVLLRADEPGEALAYYMANYGRAVPKPIKRGIADAAASLYSERSALKYDSALRGIRFADVLELCHVEPNSPAQSPLFKFLLEHRHQRDDLSVAQLPMIQANMALRSAVQERPEVLLNAAKLRLAGMTWEDVLSLGGKKLDKAAMWQAIIPEMGYMALLRNLRNFEDAGIKGDTALLIAKRLADPHEVARSRQLPMRFLSAYRAVGSSRYLQPVEEALELSLQNIPEFAGRTLILVDTSGSMHTVFSKDGTLMRWDAAVIFGLAMAKRCEHADIHSFSNLTKQFPLNKGASLLRGVEAWKSGGYFFGHGTATELAVRTTFKGHDRIVVLTDEQANWHGSADVFSSVPSSTMCVTFNLAGDRMAHAAGSNTRVTIAGLTDQAFKLLPVLEGRAAGKWPWGA